MDIRTAMSELARLQKDVQITEPETRAIAVAHKFVPPQNVDIAASLPAWTNDLTLTALDVGTSGMTTHIYTAHSQLFIGEGFQDHNADVAAGFLTQFIRDLLANTSLKTIGGVSTCTETDLVGGNPTLVGLPRGQRVFIGLDLFVTIKIVQGETIA